ncbi:MAG: hypothetical protein HQK51_10690 [Oligoflexia bacterium]|nr:hypothetical protein [Oligoflexia bacterium]
MDENKKTQNVFSDEELLSYLIGDGCKEIENRIRKEIESNPNLKTRLEKIDTLRKQVKLIPNELFYSLAKANIDQQRIPNSILARKLVKSGVLVVTAFIMGIYCESQLSLIDKKERGREALQSKNIHDKNNYTLNNTLNNKDKETFSTPLSWSEKNFINSKIF